MLFPFLPLTISLAAGILLSAYLPCPLAVWAVLTVISLACSWIFFLAFRKHKICLFLILMTSLFLGASLYTAQSRFYEKNPLRGLESTDYIDFYGRLNKSVSRGTESDNLFLRVDKVVIQKKEKRIRGNLGISVPHSQESSSLHQFHSHDQIKISAKLSPSRGFRNFHPAVLDRYLKSQNLHQRAYTKTPMLIEKLKTGKNLSLMRIISVIRRKLQRRIERYFSGTESHHLSSKGSVVEALLLGERERMVPEVTRSLQQAGIYHLFALSGAHIAIISFLFFTLFRIAKLPERTNYILLILFLSFYAFLVEGRPSILRATIMALAYLLAKLIWRSVNLLNILSLSAFLLLLFNPMNLFSLGFQLTFAATLSIILFFPKVIKLLPRLPLRISEILAVSITAQLGVLPFVASAFNRVVFSSLILNLAAIPLVGSIMALGYIFLFLSLLSPFLAGALARLIDFIVGVLISSSHLFDPIPILSFRVPTPPDAIIVGYFLCLGLLLIPKKLPWQKLIASFCFSLFLLAIIIYPFSASSKTLKMTFIDVGQGDSILVEFPGQKKMLIDGGGTPEDTFDIGEYVVSPFLWKKGIKKVDYIVLTHAHPDHMNGLKAVVRNFRTGEFWEAFSPQDSEPYEKLIRHLSSKTIRRRMFRGQVEMIDGIKIEVLNPVRTDPLFSKVHNDQSIVLRISYGRTAFLLTGDMGKEVETELVRSSFPLFSQVMKSPHHGSDSSSSQEFLLAVSPVFVIISTGAGNRYGLPDPDVLERYGRSGIRVYRTDLDGAVEVTSDGQRITLRTASPKR
jgi:competence protein ComEC